MASVGILHLRIDSNDIDLEFDLLYAPVVTGVPRESVVCRSQQWVFRATGQEKLNDQPLRSEGPARHEEFLRTDTQERLVENCCCPPKPIVGGWM